MMTTDELEAEVKRLKRLVKLLDQRIERLEVELIMEKTK